MAKCKYCRDTGKIPLLTSVVDCDCVRQNTQTPSLSCNENSGPRDFPNGSNFVNGWYSPSIAAKQGTIVYRHAISGKEIETTEISRLSTPSTNPPDLKFVGIIDENEFIRGTICC